MNNQWFSKVAVWLVIAMVLFTVFKQFDTRGGVGSGTVSYSEFLEQVRNSQAAGEKLAAPIVRVAREKFRIKLTVG